jgi:rhamnosyltransferase
MKTVQVLMSTYNGEKYLDEQIQSLILQEGVKVEILVRDDGSSDNTISKLKAWESKGVLKWYSGENIGPARSFMDLVKNAPRSDYYAFCDQDDVWDNDKLISAVKMLEKFNNKEPALYFSKTRLVDSNLKPIKSQDKSNPKITLGSALIINSATGCTEVFNHALLEVLKRYNNENIYMHDGWVYKLCLAIDGNVLFDEIAHISYRQHGNNVIGGKQSFYKKYKRRFKNLLVDRNCIRSNDARELIKGYADLIPDENLELIKRVADYKLNLKNRLKLICDKEIKTNSLEHNLAFICAVLFGVL